MTASLDRKPDDLPRTDLGCVGTREDIRGVRAMRPADLDAVGRLFNIAFRKRDQAPNADLLDYLQQVFFENPIYDPRYGSMVHENTGGKVDSAILAIPMTFNVHGRQLTARLLCAFMSNGRSGLAGAAKLARSFRPARSELCFSDNASPVSADHWTIGGGFMLPIQSLEWRRTFRPFRTAVLRLQAKLPIIAHIPLAALMTPFDMLARKITASLTPAPLSNLSSVDASPQELLGHVQAMTAHFAIRPDWSEQELQWLLQTAALHRQLGELRIRTVVNAGGKVIGCYVFFHRHGGIANVLNTFCLEGREFDVTGQMFADFNAAGYPGVRGMAQPFLMNALMRQRRITFKHRGYFCLVTKYDEVRDAAIANNIYIGGLASESWSRLLTDFR